MGSAKGIRFTLFTKPWPDKSLSELARFVKGLGFDGVELPVRPGYQVTPESAERGLPEASRILGEHGLHIGSVAGNLSGETDERLIAACRQAQVPVLRLLPRIDMSKGYWASVEDLRRAYDAYVPLLERHGVALGIQNHCGYFIGSAIGTVHLIERYDPKLVGIVLDPAHCALAGEPADMAFDVAWSRTLFVNLKNAYWRRATGTEAEDVKWRVHWTSGRQGLVSWPQVVELLKRKNYSGDICLHAEYSDADGRTDLMGDSVNRLIAEDISYVRTLV